MKLSWQVIVSIIVIVGLLIGLVYLAFNYIALKNRVDTVENSLLTLSSLMVGDISRGMIPVLESLRSMRINESVFLSTNLSMAANKTLCKLLLIQKDLAAMKRSIFDTYTVLSILSTMKRDNRVVEGTKKILNELSNIIGGIINDISMLYSQYNVKMYIIGRGNYTQNTINMLNNRIKQAINSLNMKIKNIGILINTMHKMGQLGMIIGTGRYDPLIDEIVNDLKNYENIVGIQPGGGIVHNP